MHRHTHNQCSALLLGLWAIMFIPITHGGNSLRTSYTTNYSRFMRSNYHWVDLLEMTTMYNHTTCVRLKIFAKIRADAVPWKKGNTNGKIITKSKVCTSKVMFQTETGFVKVKNDKLKKLYDDLKGYTDEIKGAKGKSDREKIIKTVAKISVAMADIKSTREDIKKENGFPLPVPKKYLKMKLPKV